MDSAITKVTISGSWIIDTDLTISAPSSGTVEIDGDDASTVFIITRGRRHDHLELDHQERPIRACPNGGVCGGVFVD